MMVAPETRVKQLGSGTIEQCLEARDEIYQLLKDVETGAYGENEIDDEDNPVYQYGYYLEVFALLNRLIVDRFEQSGDEEL